MSKYNVGDKFIIEISKNNTTELDNTEYYITNGSRVYEKEELDRLQKYEEAQIPYSEAYNKGLEDAWELAKKIILLGDRKPIFGYMFLDDIMGNLTPQEALAKLEAYEKEQYEIKVGDIVKEGKNYFLVTKRYNNTFEGMSDEGYLYCGLSLRDCEKTSKHIDLTDIFKQIGGGTNELS